MDTRPWRLQQTSSLSAVHWYDVDFPAIIDLKRKLLTHARAETGRNGRASADATTSPSPAASCSSANASASALTPLLTSPVSSVTTPPSASTQDHPDSSAACAKQSDSLLKQQEDWVPQSSFPLLTASWTAVPHDLADGSLAAALELAGFNSHLPTIWCVSLLIMK